MLYQRVTLPNENWGYPAELPADLAALKLTDDQLANLTASLGEEADQLGYAGQGFFFRPDPPPEVPSVVSRLQAKMALHSAGLLPTVEGAINASDPVTQIYWSDASEFHRDHPTLAAITANLGMSSDEVDALFIAAGAFT